MKGLIRWFLMPAVLLAGLTFVCEQPAQAARWGVRVGVYGPYGYHAHPYYRPYTSCYRGSWHARAHHPPMVVSRPYYGAYRPYPVMPYYVW